MTETIICNICHKIVKKQGIGTHKRLTHGISIKEKTIVWQKITPIFENGGLVSVDYETVNQTKPKNLKDTMEFLINENCKNTKVNLKFTKENIELTKEQVERQILLEKAEKYLK